MPDAADEVGVDEELDNHVVLRCLCDGGYHSKYGQCTSASLAMTSLPSCLRLASGEPVTTNHSSADGHKNLAVEYTMSGGGKGPEKQCSLSSNYHTPQIQRNLPLVDVISRGTYIGQRPRAGLHHWPLIASSPSNDDG